MDVTVPADLSEAGLIPEGARNRDTHGTIPDIACPAEQAMDKAYEVIATRQPMPSAPATVTASYWPNCWGTT